MEKLETWKVILIIVAVLGYIIGNIMLLKYANKFDVKGKIDKQLKSNEQEGNKKGQTEDRDESK
ncbi:DUF2897 family protein [Pseudoalteromonas luteoviolacea]|uniref:DUF2897 family protein n=1 Tax=Pseudoalteromonas luteoviolacea TaxID=43657 RepID=UPI001F203323|nr:DUF2897 family protein [Pseudoalteromonas luteoviolacea]MCF6437934.1 DUF2897 family protein [Pseudoalteromonas luteoviolacea]